MFGFESLPTRGAWIEMCPAVFGGRPPLSLPTRGAWIEMDIKKPGLIIVTSRSPHGERGLKALGRGV